MNPDQRMDNIPPHFRCPISMEVMTDPVTISTGVTYERKNIEKWLFTYKNRTCPATMQTIHDFHLTPNHTLTRLILSWQTTNTTTITTTTPYQSQSQSQSSSSSSSSSPINVTHHDLLSLLTTLQSTPFKVTSLKKLRSLIQMGGEDIKCCFVRSGGALLLVPIIVQVHLESLDFNSFGACEEALGVLHQLLLSPTLAEQDDETALLQLLSKQDCMKSMAVMLQRGSAKARYYTVLILQKMAKAGYDWKVFNQQHSVDLFKSLLELVSDEMCTKASSCALELLIEMLSSSKKSRFKAIEAGAIRVLIELLPESNRSKCEKIMLLIKLLCECADGRLAFTEHGLGIAAISKKMLHDSVCATKLGVKILWLICKLHPTEKVLEEMLVFGSVKKLVAMLHIDNRSSTRNKVMKILRLRGNSWRRYPCLPEELKDYLGLEKD